MPVFLLIGYLLIETGICQPDQNNPSMMFDSIACRVMFYNVENLFDVYDDTNKLDDDFTPAGNLHWTYKRYLTKLNNLSKVIMAAGSPLPPDIIGLCEIENEKVLFDLLHKTAVVKYNYRIVHEDSPDERGIDVALLYNPSCVQVLAHRSINLSTKDITTRDVLYVKALVFGDTCHFLINHWPSRSAGQLETEMFRIHAAEIVKSTVDSLFLINRHSNIVIMGDFNDEPEDISISQKLLARPHFSRPLPAQLINITRMPPGSPIGGTLKYQGIWNTFDQIIVSGNLLNKNSSIRTHGFSVLQNPFLLQKDEQFNGYKPFRTYLGYRYTGGFSDHLPVYADIYKIRN